MIFNSAALIETQTSSLIIVIMYKSSLNNTHVPQYEGNKNVWNIYLTIPCISAVAERESLGAFPSLLGLDSFGKQRKKKLYKIHVMYISIPYMYLVKSSFNTYYIV